MISSNKVLTLKNKQQHLAKQIEEIQSLCTHKNKELKFTFRKDVRWVCGECDKEVSFPTPTEVKNWLSTKKN